MKYTLSFMTIVLIFYYMKIVSKGNSRIVKLIYFELLYNLSIKFLIGNLGLPSALNYVSDLILIWILFEYLYHKKYQVVHIPNSLVFCTTALWITTIISYVLNIYSPLLYLWGFRNNFRFLFFGMMCAVFLKRRDIETIMDILFGYFIINIIVVTYQAFFVTYSASAIGDFISGLFSNGMERGGNASLDWLLCIVYTYTIVKYLNKVGSWQKMMVCLSGSLYIAALAEIKLFFIQVIFISIIAVLICKKSFKVFVFLIIGTVSLVFGIRVMYEMFPKFSGFFTYEVMLEYATRKGGYSSRGYDSGIDRLTAITYVFEHFLRTPFERLLGIGLGNADYSSFGTLISDFYKRNSWSGYTFFYSAFITVELGLLGLIGYIIIIINYIRKAMTFIELNMKERSVKQFVIIIGIICTFMIFANQTMKLEASAYMVHCVLVFPFILKRDNDKEELGTSLIKKLSLSHRRKHEYRI